MIQDDLKKLQNCDVSLILSDGTLQMLFFRTYQSVFGVVCKLCERSIREAYKNLVNNGNKQLEIMTQIAERTCQPSWVGLKYIRLANAHFHSEFLTDEKATALLNKGFLTEKDFKVLPTIKKEIINEFTTEEMACINEFKQLIQDGNSKDEILQAYKNTGFIGTKKCNKKLLISLIDKANEA